MTEKVYKKALIEGLRVIALAVIPLLVVAIQTGNFDLKLIIIAAAIAGLRFVDKLLHEYGKENEIPSMITGLTRF